MWIERCDTHMHRSQNPSVLQRVSHASYATKAEEYDLIVAEAGLVRIEGYELLLQIASLCSLLTDVIC